MSFPTTRWTSIAEATLHGDMAGRAALAKICEKYRQPVRRFLEARGLNNSEAEDLTQDFFLKLVESRAWKKADQAKGRFRTFLLSILNNVLMHEWRRQRTQKRGGHVLSDSLDALIDDGLDFAQGDGESAEVFDREWALTLVADAILMVEAAFVQRGQQKEFALLRRFLPGPQQMPSYEDAAVELGLSLTALKAAVHRLRQRFREVLRAAVARTVSAPHEVDEELRYLGTLLIGTQHQAQNGKEIMK